MESRPVLLVDNDLISRLMNCAILRECGFAVAEARSVAEAGRILDRTPRLAALVTNIDLGDGADGFEIARRARAAIPDLSVVYLSDAHLEPLCAREGVAESLFIPKPLDAYQIVKALEDVTPLALVQSDGAPQVR